MSPSNSSRRTPSVYVSSPFGFTEFGWETRRHLHHRLEREQWKVRDPWGWPDPDKPGASIATPDLLGTARIAGAGRDRDVSAEIAARNVTELLAADVMLAILDGADVDSGVAAEVGYASARGKPIVGLRTDARGSADSGGYPVNLQILHLILQSGPPAGRVADSLEGALMDLRYLVNGVNTPAEDSDG